jgi:hypothetical protein
VSDVKRWRGLVALVRDGVEHGSRAVERVHLEIAERTFTVLEAIPVVSAPTEVVHVVHHTIVRSVHAVVRGVSRGVTAGADVALSVVAETRDIESRDEKRDAATTQRRDED